MSKSESLHMLYEQCKDLQLQDNVDLLENAKSDEERDFIMHVTDYLLQKRQAKVVAEKRF